MFWKKGVSCEEGRGGVFFWKDSSDLLPGYIAIFCYCAVHHKVMSYYHLVSKVCEIIVIVRRSLLYQGLLRFISSFYRL